MPLCVACHSCIIDVTCGSQWRWHVRDSSTRCSKTFFIWFLCDGFILQMSFSIMDEQQRIVSCSTYCDSVFNNSSSLFIFLDQPQKRYILKKRFFIGTDDSIKAL